MMEKIKDPFVMDDTSNWSKKYKYIFLAVIILAGFIAYVMSSTHSPLWYDESIEYFYSKVLVGEVPGYPGTSDMYDRITITYQPPLYNALMHVWLLLFDSGEFTFRLAGIIVTLIGAVGLYKCIDELCGMAYASLGTLIYIFSFLVAYYALECAEYNLMLCCICWMIYFFVKCMKEKSCRAFIGFFLFACLSVYSQYGAAFLVVGVYVVLFVNCLKDKKSLKMLLIGSGIVALAAVLPLIYFFMLPQMESQGAETVSHIPVFAANPIVDYINGAVYVLQSNFGVSSPEWLNDRIEGTTGKEGFLGLFPFSIMCAALLISIIALLRKNKEYIQYAVICLITYSLYFIAVACSFYAQNFWDKGLGFSKPLYGRYCLFLAPILIITLTYGVSEFIKFLKNANYKKVMSVLMVIAAAVFCSAEIFVLSVGWVKDDMKGVCQAWYDDRGYESVTLVQKFSSANFQFYLIHNNNYNEKYYDNLIMEGEWSYDSNRDNVERHLTEMGIFEMDELYYVGTCSEYYMYTYHMTKEIFEEHGFKITALYENYSVLLHLEKA